MSAHIGIHSIMATELMSASVIEWEVVENIIRNEILKFAACCLEEKN